MAVSDALLKKINGYGLQAMAQKIVNWANTTFLKSTDFNTYKTTTDTAIDGKNTDVNLSVVNGKMCVTYTK